MSDHRNTGKWSEDEKMVFQQGIAEFGLDWQKMEEYMGGARSLNQIRHYYRTMKEKDPDMFSPEKVGSKTPKKRSSTAAGNATTTPKKKTKAVEENVKTPAKKTPKKVPAMAATSSTGTKPHAMAKKSDPTESSEEEEEEIVGKPPPLPTVSEKKAAPKKPVVAAAEKPPSGDVAVMATEEKVESSSPMKSIADFLKKEEVQTVLAGILGFVVVIIAKKFMN